MQKSSLHQSLIVTCNGGPCFQQGIVVHEGVLPSHSYTAMFIGDNTIALVLPTEHHGSFMIRQSGSFCVHVLPSYLVHESPYSLPGQQNYVEPLSNTGLESVPCSCIPTRRFTQVAASAECIVERIVKTGDTCVIYGKAVYTHLPGGEAQKLQHVVEQQLLEA